MKFFNEIKKIVESFVVPMIKMDQKNTPVHGQETERIAYDFEQAIGRQVKLESKPFVELKQGDNLVVKEENTYKVKTVDRVTSDNVSKQYNVFQTANKKIMTVPFDESEEIVYVIPKEYLAELKTANRV
jgi:hypothetical protein